MGERDGSIDPSLTVQNKRIKAEQRQPTRMKGGVKKKEPNPNYNVRDNDNDSGDD